MRSSFTLTRVIAILVPSRTETPVSTRRRACLPMSSGSGWPMRRVDSLGARGHVEIDRDLPAFEELAQGQLASVLPSAGAARQRRRRREGKTAVAALHALASQARWSRRRVSPPSTVMTWPVV